MKHEMSFVTALQAGCHARATKNGRPPPMEHADNLPHTDHPPSQHFHAYTCADNAKRSTHGATKRRQH